MAETAPFDWLCAQLEARTELSILEVRGTVRLALKASGLDVNTVRAQELAVVLERVLPKELATRGVEEAETLASAIADQMRLQAFSGGREGPDAIFERLGR